MTNILIKVVAVVIAGGITLAIVDLAAPRPQTQLCVEMDPDAGEDLDLGLLPERLGIDQQTVHVEDDRLDHTVPATVCARDAASRVAAARPG